MVDRHRGVALVLSVGLHVAVLFGVGLLPSAHMRVVDVPPEMDHIVLIDLVPPPVPTELSEPPAAVRPAPPASPPSAPVRPSDMPDVAQPASAAAPLPEPGRPRASMDAPPAPTAEEWAAAATYTLKNSKRYRYTWGQQVRSMMGTAVEGAGQGIVRFRIEISPTGSLARLETIWSTSDTVEALARRAVEQMPPVPPTPDGKPLIFEKTISFQAFDSGGPPIYKDDCLPDPPVYRNPFAWDGKSPQVRAEPVVSPGNALDPQALAECFKQLTPDSIEAEAADNQRQLEQWGSDRLTRTEVPRSPR